MTASQHPDRETASQGHVAACHNGGDLPARLPAAGDRGAGRHQIGAANSYGFTLGVSTGQALNEHILGSR